ncbi:MAG: hypothetical protein AAFQ80_16460 [Cyanobacteria bacterium J06621_8]
MPEKLVSYKSDSTASREKCDRLIHARGLQYLFGMLRSNSSQIVEIPLLS